MAENEYLDSTKAIRWRVIAQAIREGRDIDDITELVRDRFYKTLRNIRRDLPLSELIESIGDPAELGRLVEGIDGAWDVKDFLIQAAHEENGRQDVLDRFLRDALGNCLYDIPHQAATIDGDVNLSGARHIMNDVQRRLAPDLRSIAKKLDDDPSFSPRMRGGSKRPAALGNDTGAMLGESLITGFRK